MAFFSKHKSTIFYGMAMALLLFILKWLELRLLIIDHAFEIYAAAIAICFTSLGIWLAVKLMRPKTATVIETIRQPPTPFVFNESECKTRNISKRELEVLKLMSNGLSNVEIAAALFVSVNTIKSHTARLFEKLEVNRRIQAIDKAKNLGLLE